MEDKCGTYEYITYVRSHNTKSQNHMQSWSNGRMAPPMRMQEGIDESNPWINGTQCAEPRAPEEQSQNK